MHPVMKKLAIAITISLAAATLVAHENHENGKSCDMGKGKEVAIAGKVTCKGDDCSFTTADAKQTFSLCEMSKADLPKLSESGATVKVSGKLITCEGKEKLRIEKVAE
jgi:type 1 fimbria pilin